MDDKIKYLLIGLGAYLLYQSYSATPAAIVSGGTPAVPVPPSGATPVPITTPTAAQTLGQQLAGVTAPYMIQAVNSAGGSADNSTMLNASQWNWYLTQVSGIPGQALGDDGSPMNVTSYIALLQRKAAGLSGLRGLAKVETFDMERVAW